MKRTTSTSLTEMQEKLGALHATVEPSTIEDSLGVALVRATHTDLMGLARRAFRRGYRETLALIHAEFLRRRSGARAAIAA